MMRETIDWHATWFSQQVQKVSQQILGSREWKSIVVSCADIWNIANDSATWKQENTIKTNFPNFSLEE